MRCCGQYSPPSSCAGLAPLVLARVTKVRQRASKKAHRYQHSTALRHCTAHRPQTLPNHCDRRRCANFGSPWTTHCGTVAFKIFKQCNPPCEQAKREELLTKGARADLKRVFHFKKAAVVFVAFSRQPDQLTKLPIVCASLPEPRSRRAPWHHVRGELRASIMVGAEAFASWTGQRRGTKATHLSQILAFNQPVT